MKVIFLDIDGVLCVRRRMRDRYGALFHKRFEDNLRWIIEQTNAKIVISSSWRFDGIDILRKMWVKRKLAGEIIDITPNIGICKRGLEIKQWLSINKVDNYVIIDDDTDMLDTQLNNFVRTSLNKDHPDCVDIGYGLTRKCSEQAIKILNEK